MHRTLTALALVASLGFTLDAADDKSSEVKEYVSKEGRFKARIPGEVKTKANKAGDLTITSAMSQPKQGQVFQVVFFDMPVEIPADGAKEVLKQIAAGIKGKTLSEKEVSHGKAKIPGKEAIYELPGAHIRQLMLLDGKRVYQVIVGGPKKDDVTTKEADAFIESFQVVK